MPLRFWCRRRLFPRARINLSKSGLSLSVGMRGAWFTVGPRGRRATVGLPPPRHRFFELRFAQRAERTHFLREILIDALRGERGCGVFNTPHCLSSAKAHRSSRQPHRFLLRLAQFIAAPF
jgi:hypothetical protein